MITKEEIVKILRENKPFLQDKYKVKEIGVFGSYSRGEATSQSDLDILVDFSGSIGWDFFELNDFLEQKLNMKVDLVTPRALKPRMKSRILSEVVFQ